MTINIKVTKNSCKMQFSDELAVFTASEFKAEIVSKWENWKKLVIDLSNVDEIDGAGLQLLLSLRRTCEMQKIEFNVSAVSEATENLFQLYQLDNNLLPHQDISEE